MEKTIIKNAHVISPDVDLENATIVIDGKTIKQVSKKPVSEKGASTVVDVKGQYVMPGFIDVHTHGALSGRIAGRRCGKAVIYTRHSAFPVPAKLKYPPGRWVNKLVNEHYADHIIAVSPAAAQKVS